jgi:hypothetical protein
VSKCTCGSGFVWEVGRDSYGRFVGGLGTGGGRRRKLSGLLVWERSSVGEDKGGGKIHVHTGMASYVLPLVLSPTK